MIKFKSLTELTIVTQFDEENDNIVDEVTIRFNPGELVDAEVISVHEDNEKYVDIEFPRGVAFSVHRDCFEEIPD